jgi:hypothetical protein
MSRHLIMDALELCPAEAIFQLHWARLSAGLEIAIPYLYEGDAACSALPA